MDKNKEWICETLAHRDGEKAPYNFLFCPPARRLLEGHYGTSKLEECLDFPIRMSGCRSVKPLYADPAEFGASLRDEYGCARASIAFSMDIPSPSLLSSHR